MIKRQTSISKNIVQFCKFLRHKGFVLGVQEERVALDALQFIDFSNQHLFQLALKSVLCKNKNQLAGFDELYDEYWRQIDRAIDSKIMMKEKPDLQKGYDDSFKALKSWLNDNQNKELEKVAFYSAQENISEKDFSKVPPDELDEIMQRIKAISKRLAAHLSYRYKKSNRLELPDLRRTLRRNMRRGGELVEIVFKKPKPNRTKLVILCDVSKSMELYAMFLLQFMYAFQQVYGRIETFVFGTSLQRITSILKQNNFTHALKLLSAQGSGWSGGTKIGECLDDFVKTYASKFVDKKTIVIILSDGWDTGDIKLLEQSMQAISQSSKKLIWLNPLAGYSSYRPDVAGMQAAMPYIDAFGSVHNIDSLKKLAKWL